jgi:hypothetical protein
MNQGQPLAEPTSGLVGVFARCRRGTAAARPQLDLASLCAGRGRGCDGALVLAGVGLGLYSEGSVGVDWGDQTITEPDLVPPAALLAGYSKYQALYPSLKPLFAAPQLELPTSQNPSDADHEALRVAAGDDNSKGTRRSLPSKPTSRRLATQRGRAATMS